MTKTTIDLIAPSRKPNFSTEALENIAECGIMWAADFDSLSSGRVSAAELLDMCLYGADEGRAQGWYDYVLELSILAGVEPC